MADYSNVDSNNNLSPNGSVYNILLLGSEFTFTIIFIVEFMIKVLATGWFKSPYKKDPQRLWTKDPYPTSLINGIGWTSL